MANKKEAVLTALEAKIGKRDTYGNWTFKGKYRTYRIKPQATSLRFEEKWVFSDGTSQWHNITMNRSHYYKDADIEKITKIADRMKELSNTPEKD